MLENVEVYQLSPGKPWFQFSHCFLIFRPNCLCFLFSFSAFFRSVTGWGKYIFDQYSYATWAWTFSITRPWTPKRTLMSITLNKSHCFTLAIFFQTILKISSLIFNSKAVMVFKFAFDRITAPCFSLIQIQKKNKTLKTECVINQLK